MTGPGWPGEHDAGGEPGGSAIDDPATAEIDSPASRFVVSAPPAVLSRLLAGLSAEPAVEVLAVSGPADRPRRAVVRMTDRRAADLTGGCDPVVVEPDADLAPPAPAVPPAPPIPPAPPAPTLEDRP